MKSMQRKFGGMMKRSADDADAAGVMAEFKSVEGMLETLMKDLKLYRSQWEDILNNNFTLVSALYELYKPIEPTQDPDQRHQPAQTPQRFTQKAHTLYKEYVDLKNDLNTELDLINTRLIQPVEHAKLQLKPVHKTIKHRENMKLDYEKYLSRAEHVRHKETRSVKDEAALASHESDLAQAKIDYEVADEQVRITLPPISAAVLSMLPLIATSQVMVTTNLVGQTYTILDAWCRRMGIPSPAPSDDMIIAEWDREFTGFRQEMEGGLRVLANGKAVGQSMTLQEKPNSLTGLGLRGRVTGRMPGNSGGGGFKMPSFSGKSSSQEQQQALPAPPGTDHNSTYSASNYGGEEELAPPKPPRPGTSSPGYGGGNVGSPPPQINLNNKPQIASQSKPRIPSSSSPLPYPDSNTLAIHQNSFNYQQNSPPAIPSPGNLRSSSYSNGHTPPSIYGTPLNGRSPQPSYPPSPGPSYNNLTPTPSNVSQASHDYFGANQRRPSQASLASSAASMAAGKKKPPPPPAPKPKRLGSQQSQFVVALYDFEGQGQGDLGFREGDRIKVVKKTGSQDDWWDGELRGVVGSFPANYVQKDGWV